MLAHVFRTVLTFSLIMMGYNLNHFPTSRDNCHPLDDLFMVL